MPIPEIRAEYEDKNESSWLDVTEIIKQTGNFSYGEIPKQHKNFWEILECMQSMNTFYELIHLYIMGGSHMGNHRIDLTNEVKAIEALKTWIRYANDLHRLIDCKEKVELTDRLIMKIAREAKPTTFQMPNNERCYDDKKSVITFLSAYEDNTKSLQEKNKGKNMIQGKNRIQKYLKNEGADPFVV